MGSHDFGKAAPMSGSPALIISALGHCPYIGFRIKAYALSDRVIAILSELNVGR
jgi:hypothetical protein